MNTKPQSLFTYYIKKSSQGILLNINAKGSAHPNCA